jgi:hypothetical protein
LPVLGVYARVNDAFIIITRKEECIVLVHVHEILHKCNQRSMVGGKDEVGPNQMVRVLEDVCAAGYWPAALHDFHVEVYAHLVLSFRKESQGMFK